MKIVKFENFNKIKVVRWSTEKILAKNLVPQEMSWGGFDATALSFCPYDNENDERFLFWKNSVEKHHNKKCIPNKYILDLSNFPYKTEKELTKIGHLSYKDINIENELKELGINLTLSYLKSGLKIVEIRLYENCKIKILDDFS